MGFCLMSGNSCVKRSAKRWHEAWRPDVPSEWIWQICCPCRWWCRAQNGLPETHWQPCRLGSLLITFDRSIFQFSFQSLASVTHGHIHIHIIFKIMFEMQEHTQLLSAQEKITARATRPPRVLFSPSFPMHCCFFSCLDVQGCFTRATCRRWLDVCAAPSVYHPHGLWSPWCEEPLWTWFSSCDRHWWAEHVDVQVYIYIYIYI